MQQYPGPFPKKQWTPQARSQIRTFTKNQVAAIVKGDSRWEYSGMDGGRTVFRNPLLPSPWNYLAVHTSKQEYQNPSLLFWMLDHICCTESDLKKRGFIK